MVWVLGLVVVVVGVAWEVGGAAAVWLMLWTLSRTEERVGVHGGGSSFLVFLRASISFLWLLVMISSLIFRLVFST